MLECGYKVSLFVLLFLFANLLKSEAGQDAHTQLFKPFSFTDATKKISAFKCWHTCFPAYRMIMFNFSLFNSKSI